MNLNDTFAAVQAAGRHLALLPDGKNADCLVGVQHFGSLFVDMYLSLSETFAVSYPFLDTRYGLGCGDKTSANRLFGMLYEVDEDVVAFAIGNNYCNTFICHFAGNVGFGQHASSPETH